MGHFQILLMHGINHMCKHEKTKTIMTFTPDDDPGRILSVHTLQKCIACGFIYLDPVPTQEELDRLHVQELLDDTGLTNL